MIRTANDAWMKVQGVSRLELFFPLDGKPSIPTPDGVILVKGLTSDLFSLWATKRAGHKFVDEDDHVSLFDGRFT